MPMGRPACQFRSTVIIEADLDAVVGWFVDPRRTEEWVASLGQSGVSDVNMTKVDAAGRRIADYWWTTADGSLRSYRTETILGPEGASQPVDGGYRISRDEVSRVRQPNGREAAMEYSTVWDFRQGSPGSTTVSITTRQQVNERRWFERLLPPVAARAEYNKNVVQQAHRCAQELSKRQPSEH